MHVRLRIAGVVQGVGFRPFVFRLANELLLKGFVRNDEHGVFIEVVGPDETVGNFVSRLTSELPPLAQIDRTDREELDGRADEWYEFGGKPEPDAFVIRTSQEKHDGLLHRRDLWQANRQPNGALRDAPSADTTNRITPTASALVSPDIATCDDCISELNDPFNRRYQYPFTNCTNCGPRFTIIQSAPYDRMRTTMSAFTMCAQCQCEYDDPGNRRFHAQPNACALCGPTLRLVRPTRLPDPGAATYSIDGTSAPISESAVSHLLVASTINLGTRSASDSLNAFGTRSESDTITYVARSLLEGEIVAIKGVGGYHIACLASDYGAVQRLRKRKHRPDKPFAIMVPDNKWIRRLVETDALAESLLQSRARPILLGRRKVGAEVAVNVAPRLHELGIMLPYSPLHQLILQQCDKPLVMTSGNLANEPIAYRDADALERLGTIADLFLMHNREIETPTDDSVVRVVSVDGEPRPMMLRRSRGYAPAPFVLPVAATAALLACGGELKNTYCVAHSSRAWVGPHVGDLGNVESRLAFQRGTEHHEDLFGVAPRLFVHDLHPGYASTQYAMRRAEGIPGGTTIAVQHHHAHFAACLAEHGVRGPAGAVILDGAGLGSDGTLWGGELLRGDLNSFSRVAHLWPVAMPGGEAAIREPWRMACGWLCELLPNAHPPAPVETLNERFREPNVRTPPRTPPLPRLLHGRVTDAAWRNAALVARNQTFSPVTTSVGRLLDALSAICGVCATVTYEGQAAIELEAVADLSNHSAYTVPLVQMSDHVRIDARALVASVIGDTERGESVATISARIHNALATAIAECCARVFPRGFEVVLSGGVFQNALLVQLVSAALVARGFRPLVPRDIPPNDGGIAFGQAAVAASGGL